MDVSGQLHDVAAFQPGNSPHLQILQVAKLLQNLSGSCEEEKNYVPTAK
jgi:hypothetical protein